MITSKFNLTFNLGRIVTGFFIVEEVTVFLLSMLDSSEAPEGIKVPVASSKLTISDDL